MILIVGVIMGILSSSVSVTRYKVKGNLEKPATAPVETKEDIEGALLEKVYLYERIFVLTNNLCKHFISLRVTGRWEKDVVMQIRKWVAS